jgi:hypothetical protein
MTPSVLPVSHARRWRRRVSADPPSVCPTCPTCPAFPANSLQLAGMSYVAALTDLSTTKLSTEFATVSSLFILSLSLSRTSRTGRVSLRIATRCARPTCAAPSYLGRTAA